MRRGGDHPPLVKPQLSHSSDPLGVASVAPHHPQVLSCQTTRPTERRDSVELTYASVSEIIPPPPPVDGEVGGGAWEGAGADGDGAGAGDGEAAEGAAAEGAD